MPLLRGGPGPTSSCRSLYNFLELGCPKGPGGYGSPDDYCSHSGGLAAWASGVVDDVRAFGRLASVPAGASGGRSESLVSALAECTVGYNIGGAVRESVETLAENVRADLVALPAAAGSAGAFGALCCSSVGLCCCRRVMQNWGEA